jgi:diaminopimelate decarboxylase
MVGTTRFTLSQRSSILYAGEKVTKFGIYKDRYEEALALARDYDLKIKTLHFHCGSGYLNLQIETLAMILERSHWFLDKCPEIDILDIGGGLGVPLVKGDQPLDMEAWSEMIAAHARERRLEIQVEPGDFLVKDAGILLLKVNTVERKGNVNFIGVNGGFNIQNLAAYYRIPFEVAHLALDGKAEKEQVTIAGNINEVIDIFAENVSLPPIAEGDLLGFLNVGGYGSASSSNHCMRGQFSEYLLLD